MQSSVEPSEAPPADPLPTSPRPCPDAAAYDGGETLLPCGELGREMGSTLACCSGPARRCDA
eukprot:8934931-Pyramimonas_sp.AAC.1